MEIHEKKEYLEERVEPRQGKKNSKVDFKARQRKNDIKFIIFIIAFTICLTGGYLFYTGYFSENDDSNDNSLGINDGNNQNSDNNNNNNNRPADEQLKWYDYEDGIAFANEKNRHVIIDFYADWCGPCKNMEKDLYTDSRFIEKSDAFVLIKVNGDYRRDLMNLYGVESYPTIVFLDRNQNEVGERWIGWGYEIEKQINEFLEYMDNTLAN